MNPIENASANPVTVDRPAPPPMPTPTMPTAPQMVGTELGKAMSGVMNDDPVSTGLGQMFNQVIMNYVTSVFTNWMGSDDDDDE